MNIVKNIAIAAAFFLSTAIVVNAQEEQGGFKMGFYGSIANFGSSNEIIGLFSGEAPTPDVNKIGLLFNIGNGLELNLGIGYTSVSIKREITTPVGSDSREVGVSLWAIVPGVSYQIGKKDFIRYGAGLDALLSSWSVKTTAGGQSVTTEPNGMDMAFTPYFYISAEIVKNFEIGLKAGLQIYMPADQEESELGYKDVTKTTVISTGTEIGFKFYL